MIVQGKQRRFVSADLGGVPITEIWLGDKRIWPDMEGVARRIVVQLPAQGTREWQYWVHAVDSVNDKASSSNYMKFTVNGLDFFINHSYDGTPPYKLKGNELTLDLYDGVLIDQLGTTLSIDCVIPKREERLSGAYSGGEKTVRSAFPLLPGTITQWQHEGWKRGGDSWWHETVTSEPDGTTLVDSGYRKSGRTAVTHSSAIENSPATGTYWEALISMTGLGQINWYTAIYPAFKYTFNLKIISVS